MTSNRVEYVFQRNSINDGGVFVPLQFFGSVSNREGQKTSKTKGGVQQKGSPLRPLPNLASTGLQFRNPIKMVKKRIRDAEVLPEAPAQASTQDDDSGSDEVILLVIPHLPSLTGL
jgi:hypothetical protein